MIYIYVDACTCGRAMAQRAIASLTHPPVRTQHPWRASAALIAMLGIFRRCTNFPTRRIGANCKELRLWTSASRGRIRHTRPQGRQKAGAATHLHADDDGGGAKRRNLMTRLAHRGCSCLGSRYRWIADDSPMSFCHHIVMVFTRVRGKC